MRLKFAVAGLFLALTIPAFPQAAPSATQGGLPLNVGVGFSRFYSDWSGYLSGPTAWIDWQASHVPQILQGVGIEAQGRDLNYDRTGTEPKLREDTFAGGVTYHWRHWDRTQLFGKGLVGLGHINFNDVIDPYYTHDSRTIFVPGGGVDCRIVRNVWLHGDYEYQFWLDFFHHHAMNPQGLSVGLAYDLSNRRAR